MIFDGKPTTEITAADIEALLRERVEENAFLEYKSMPHARNPKGVHELVKDVCALANAEGGYLIIGIVEEAGNPRRPGGFGSVENPESERTRMIDICLTKIQPRLPELDIGVVMVGEKPVLICRVPDAPQKPYLAWPDAEHHAFWRRYGDGTRLMTLPEIRECFEGDRVFRAVSQLTEELTRRSDRESAARELAQPPTAANAFRAQTREAFRRYADAHFQEATSGKPYYRLMATPLPVNRVEIRSKLVELQALLHRPPEVRDGGWDLSPDLTSGFSVTEGGLVRDDMDYKHLRVYWNGHTEFWTEVDDGFFRLDGGFASQPAERRFLFPYAIIEPIANFVFLVRKLCELVGHDGELEFGLEFRNIRGLYLAPGHPESRGYRWGRSNAGRSDGAKPYPDADLLAFPVTLTVGELPDQVVWRLASQVYQRFGWMLDEHVPFFDKEHNFILNGEIKLGGSA